MKESLQTQLQTLSKLYKEADHIYSGIASHFGMTDTEFWILYVISHSKEKVTQNDLRSELFFPVQTINSAIGKLTKREFIELKMIPKTRNRKEIVLTPAGEEFVEKTIDITDEIERKAFLRFSAEERELYLSLFKRHIDNLKIEEKNALDCISN